MSRLMKRQNRDTDKKHSEIRYEATRTKEWLSARGAQQSMYDRSDLCHDNFYIAKQVKLPYDNKTTYAYNSFNSLTSFLDYQSTIVDDNRHFYELIRENTPCKEYYDIDSSKTNFESASVFLTEFDSLRREFIQTQDIITDAYDKDKLLETYQKDCYGYIKTYNRNLIPCQIVTESCNDNKMSLHIIYNHRCIFKNSQDLKIFMTAFNSFIKTKKTDIEIDLSVYNRNSLMRCIGSSKALDTTRKFNIFCTTFPIENLFISNSNCQVTYNLNITEQQKRDKSEYPPMTDEDELQFCKTLIKKINKERASDYEKWFKMGCGLFNTLNGSKEGLDIFLEFSELCPSKYDENSCIALYQSFRDPELNDNIGKGSLIYWFNEDNDKVFKKKHKM